MNFKKIFLFVLLGFFFISIGSAKAANPTSGSVTVTVLPQHGGWTVWNPLNCPTAPGSPASVQTRSCTNPTPANGGDDCKTLDGGNDTSACPAIGKWSIITKDDCTKAEGSKASTLTAVCVGPGVCIGAAPILKCDPVGTWSIDKCSTECGKEAITLIATCTGPGTCIDSAPTKNCLKTKECPSEVCSTPLTKTVTVQCDLNTNGDTATSGLVTRSQTKSDYPECTFETPVTVDNSKYVSDTCKYPLVVSPSETCITPLTKDITGITCDLNAKGEAAISGSVIRRQTKESPSCEFGNSKWLSDTCKYSEDSSVNTCSNGAVNPGCTIDDGGSCVNGAKNPSACTIDVNGSCLNGAQNPPSCTILAVIDGGWSNWSQHTNCPGSGTQTRTCTNPIPSGVGAKSCVGESSREYIADECPSLDVSFTYKDKILAPGKMIPYNSKVKVIWNSKNVESCSYSSKDSTGKIIINSLPINKTDISNGSLATPFLKKNTTYEITCDTVYLETISGSVTIPVDKINANYIEQ